MEIMDFDNPFGSPLGDLLNNPGVTNTVVAHSLDDVLRSLPHAAAMLVGSLPYPAFANYRPGGSGPLQAPELTRLRVVHELRRQALATLAHAGASLAAGKLHTLSCPAIRLAAEPHDTLHDTTKMPHGLATCVYKPGSNGPNWHSVLLTVEGYEHAGGGNWASHKARFDLRTDWLSSGPSGPRIDGVQAQLNAAYAAAVHRATGKDAETMETPPSQRRCKGTGKFAFACTCPACDGDAEDWTPGSYRDPLGVEELSGKDVDGEMAYFPDDFDDLVAVGVLLSHEWGRAFGLDRAAIHALRCDFLGLLWSIVVDVGGAPADLGPPPPFPYDVVVWGVEHYPDGRLYLDCVHRDDDPTILCRVLVEKSALYADPARCQERLIKALRRITCIRDGPTDPDDAWANPMGFDPAREHIYVHASKRGSPEPRDDVGECLACLLRKAAEVTAPSREDCDALRAALVDAVASAAGMLAGKPGPAADVGKVQVRLSRRADGSTHHRIFLSSKATGMSCAAWLNKSSFEDREYAAKSIDRARLAILDPSRRVGVLPRRSKDAANLIRAYRAGRLHPEKHRLRVDNDDLYVFDEDGEFAIWRGTWEGVARAALSALGISADPPHAAQPDTGPEKG